MPCTLFRLV
uniref:Uncharacterized protein n=1 Tax=Arundo donax TaxID=35708 RepID=A0A0A8ZWT3_ARUDO